ncbi:hypothetical protein [Inquilinus sp.]|uniref:hypothetical protein n=1 Tax=Inquilinus sp. TaxID=1932117 RepID=UPI0031DB6FC9
MAGLFAGIALTVVYFKYDAAGIAAVERFQPLIAAIFALFAGFLAYSSNIENIRVTDRARRIERRAQYLLELEQIESALETICKSAQYLLELKNLTPKAIAVLIDEIDQTTEKMKPAFEKATPMIGRRSGALFSEIQRRTDWIKVSALTLTIEPPQGESAQRAAPHAKEMRTAASQLLTMTRKSIDALFEDT